jgi:hypothetical protein
MMEEPLKENGVKDCDRAKESIQYQKNNSRKEFGVVTGVLDG